MIIEEIRSYLDDPSEYAQILLQQALFGSGPMGREICGDEADIRVLPEQTIRDFWAATYRPTNIVVAVAGDLDHDRAVELVGPASAGATAPGPPYSPAPVLPAGRALPARPPRRVAGPAGDRPCRPTGATTPTPGRWPSSTASSATG